MTPTNNNQNVNESLTSPNLSAAHLPPYIEGSRPKRIPVPLHHGFGLGAQEICNKSLMIARNIHEQKQRKFQELLSQRATPSTPVGENPAPTSSSATGTQNINEISAPTPLKNTKAGDTEPLTIPISTPSRSEAQTEILPRPQQSNVSRWRGLIACLLDTTIFASLVTLSFAVHALYAKHFVFPVFARLSGYLARWVPLLPMQQMAVILQSFTLGITLVFCIQFLSVLSTSTTIGRLITKVEPEKDSLFLSIPLALSEVITLGGILTLPKVLWKPSQHPLFPWIRMRHSK